ncbi:MAG: hypothetical protein ABI999_15965 [Acidobacteriota bacterium]
MPESEGIRMEQRPASPARLKPNRRESARWSPVLAGTRIVDMLAGEQ